MTRKGKFKEGMRFHHAHAAVAKVVAHSAANGITLSEAPLVELKHVSPQLGADVSTVFDGNTALKSHRAMGVPSPENITKWIARWRSLLRSQ